MTNPTWKRSLPTAPGFYFFKLNMSEPTEVIEVYQASTKNGQHRYGWSNPKLTLGKRMHDPEAVEAEELSGFYLVVPGEKAPRPIDVEAASAFPEAKPVAAKKKTPKKKAAAKKGAASESSEKEQAVRTES